MKKKMIMVFILLMTAISFIPVSAMEEILYNLRKTGTNYLYSSFQNNSIYVTETVKWAVTYNAGSGEIVACEANVYVEPESIGEGLGYSDWSFSSVSVSGPTTAISSNKGSCTVSYTYSFTVTRYKNGIPETKYISKNNKLVLTSEGASSQK